MSKHVDHTRTAAAKGRAVQRRTDRAAKRGTHTTIDLARVAAAVGATYLA